MKDGRREGRDFLPKDFDAEIYISLHPDIQNIVANKSPQAQKEYAMLHYGKDGRKEGRHFLPKDFDSATYLALNPSIIDSHATGVAYSLKIDAHAQTDLWARVHYAHWGRLSGWGYLPKDFDAETYISLHPDIQNIVANKSPQAQKEYGSFHYAKDGRKEGRFYLPIDFNSQTYLHLNQHVLDAHAIAVASSIGINAQENHDLWARYH